MKKILFLCIVMSLIMSMSALDTLSLAFSNYTIGGESTDLVEQYTQKSNDLGKVEMQTITDKMSYFYINSPSAMSYNDTTLLIADEYPNHTKILGFDTEKFGNEEITPIENIHFEVTIGVIKLELVDNNILLLDKNSDLYCYDIEQQFLSKILQNNVSDFDIYTGKIFVLSDNTITSFANLENLKNDKQEQGTKKLKDKTIKFAMKTYQGDIQSSEFFYLVKVDRLSYIYNEKNNEIIKVSTTIYNMEVVSNNLYYIENLTLKNHSNGKSKDNVGYVAINEYDNQAYSIAYENNGTGYSVESIDKTNLSTSKAVMKSKSNEDGFFDTPSALVSRHNHLYIADTNNDRVATYGNDGYDYTAIEYDNFEYDNKSLQKPYHIAVDDEQTLYALINDTMIVKMDADKQTTELVVNVGIHIPLLNGIVFDGMNNLYAYTESEIYSIDIDEKILETNEVIPIVDKIMDIYTTYDQQGFYILTDNNDVLYFDGEKLKDLYHLPKDSLQIVVDYKDNIFAIDSQGVLTKYCANDDYSTTKEFEIGLIDTGNEKRIDMAIASSTISTLYGQLEINDLVILDTITHTMNIVDGEIIEIENIIEYPTPEQNLWLGAESFETESKEIIYGAKQFLSDTKNNVSLYEFPNTNSKTLTTLTPNDAIVMLVQNLDSHQNKQFPNYAYVMVDRSSTIESFDDNGNIDGEKPNDTSRAMTGYILKSNFSNEKYNYVNISQRNPRVRLGSYLYQYPTRYSQRLNNGEPLEQGKDIKILPFTIRNINGIGWSRVQYGETVGFMMNSNIEQDTITKENTSTPNATIVLKSNQKIVLDNVVAKYNTDVIFARNSIELKNGDRVTVVGGWFNPSLKTTVIEYTDSDGIVWEGEIESKYIRSDNVSLLQFYAIIVAVVLIILFAIIVLLYHRNCKLRHTLAMENVEEIASENIEIVE